MMNTVPESGYLLVAKSHIGMGGGLRFEVESRIVDRQNVDNYLQERLQ
jgi:hypothetical protein